MSDTTPSAVDKYTSMQVMQSFPAYALWVKFTDYAALSAQLEAAQTQLAEEIRVSNLRGNHIECELLPQMADLEMLLKNAAKVTVQEAAMVLLETMVNDRPAFDAMVDAAEDTYLAGASFNKVVGNALRAIAGGRTDPPAAKVTECPECKRRLDWHIANFNDRVGNRL